MHRILLNMYLKEHMYGKQAAGYWILTSHTDMYICYQYTQDGKGISYVHIICTCALGTRQCGYTHTLTVMDMPESSEGLSYNSTIISKFHPVPAQALPLLLTSKKTGRATEVWFLALRTKDDRHVIQCL